MLRSARDAVFGKMGLGAQNPVRCDEKDPPHYPYAPFWFKTALHAHDVPSVRRGYEVYRQVCATCHSMKFLAFRHMTNQVYPEARVKQFAQSYDVTDGPGEDGEMFQRPGIPTDIFPSPYPNEEAARYSNGGALPPDLSSYAKAKHDGPDYLLALLIGYREPPVGVNLRPGLYYNTYYPGGAIAMPPPLTETDQVEYEDGTPATVPQMAKDVSQFIAWASEPVHDERMVYGAKMVSGCVVWMVFHWYFYRYITVGIKTKRIDFTKVLM